MSYDLICWANSANMTPDNPTFEAWRSSRHQKPRLEPSAALIAFADALLARYPDLGRGSSAQDTVWAFGPIKSGIAGDYMDLHIQFEAAPGCVGFILETARKCHVDCLDPQGGEFYPAVRPEGGIARDREQ